jgi:predicted permease
VKTLRTFWLRIRSLGQRREVKQDIDDELRFHLEQRAAENLAAGMPPEEAAREARKRFGNVQSIREKYRDVRGASFGEGAVRDVRFALRQLLKSPGFTSVAVLSLALGIGANTTIFSGLNAVLLRSLPVRNPHELRSINWVGHNPQLNSYTGIGMSDAPAGGLQMGTSFPYPAYRDFRDRGKGFTDVFAFFALKSVTAVARGEASIAGTMLISGNYFSGYGVNLLIGRPIAPEDDRPGAAPVAVISYRWWERHCGLDPNVLGQSITLNQVSYTVIGVLPRHYMGPMMGDPTDIYVPMSAQPHLVPSRPLDSPNRWWVQIMGRIAPGANDAQAEASLAVLFQQVLSESNSKMDQPGILLEDGSRGQMMLRQRLAKPFFALTIVVGLVLLIACANLAGLLLARGAARQHEMAVRAALGAGRWRLIRQSLIESLVLSLAGAGLGLVVAAWSKRALAGFLTFLPDGFRFDVRTDTNVLVFTLCVSVLTALVFGFLPALRASRADPLAGLKSQSALGTPRLRLGKVLVSGQVGLAVLLVVGAGLMIRTFANLARVQPGFDPQNVLLFRLDPGQAGYEGQKIVAFYDQTRAALSAIPGVRAVAFSGFPLASGAYSSETVEFPGREKRPGDDWQTAVLGVSEDFFRTMAIPLLAGRDFNVADTAEGPPIAVVNETFARRFLGDGNPLGQTFMMQDGTGRAFQIVGLCLDATYNQVRAEVPPIVFFSQRQRPQGGVCFEVRSALPPLALVPSVRKAVAGLDANLPLSRIKTQEQQLDQSLAADRLFASLGGAFALLAVLLSCIGLYGLMAYNVSRRTREIGLRMALGATAQNVAGPILREALLLVLAGLSVGLPVALALARLIKSQLYGIAPADPVTLAATGVLLIAVAILSGWIPARRAARVNPMVALRCE